MIESLEARIAPAGIVNVAFSKNILSITGDDLDNAFNITQDAAAGTIRIESAPVGADTNIALKGGTTALFQEIAIPDFSKLVIKINTKGGDDSILVGDDSMDALTAKALSVSTGTGGDSVGIANVRISGKGATVVKLNQGSEIENDLLTLNHSEFSGSVALFAGDGDNEFYMGTNNNIMGGMGIHTTNGNDSVNLIDSTIGSILWLTGKGNDLMLLRNVTVTNAIVLDGNKGNDNIIVDMVNAGKAVTIKLGSDTALEMNTATITDLFTNKKVSILGGNGVDDVDLTDIRALFLSIALSGGNDEVTSEDITAPTLNWNMGAGDDNFSATNIMSANVTWNVGGGLDVVAGVNLNVSTKFLLKSDRGEDDTLMLDPMTSMLPPKFQTRLDQLDFTAGVGFSF